MNTNATRAAGPATLVDCPLCDAPVSFDASDDAFGCAACGTSLPLAVEPVPAWALAAVA